MFLVNYWKNHLLREGMHQSTNRDWQVITENRAQEGAAQINI